MSANVVDRLAALPLFADVPRAELEWLTVRGELRECSAGTVLLETGAPSEEMYILLAGRAAVYADKGGGARRKVTESRTGEVLGAVPYSRMRTAPAHLIVDDDATILALRRADFPELQRECAALVTALVHQMIDRTRTYQTALLQDDRLQSLGRLASGLAHELNNPASAASRSARSLAPLLEEAERAARALTHARLSDDQLAILDSLGAACAVPARAYGAIELADREDRFAEWLDRHNLDTGGAAALGSSGVEIDELDRLSAGLPPAVLGAALTWLASGRAARALAEQVASATSRIHGLVEAIKGFTFMDREMVPGEVDVAQGLADTLAVLQNKSRRLSVDVRLDVAPNLPNVYGFGSEINQVWEKLVDNAIDAAASGGHVTVRAASRGDGIVVEVTDDGPGILETNRARVFDPFFTTKAVGQGTGLGLHLARRLVLFHHGDIDFSSAPGCTTFRVRLPAANALGK